jgi:hypothetical protein
MTAYNKCLKLARKLTSMGVPFNDTLAFTDARVLVLAPINREGYFGGAARKVAKRLTPAEFNTYELQKDEEFDFSQFKNPE